MFTEFLYKTSYKELERTSKENTPTNLSSLSELAETSVGWGYSLDFVQPLQAKPEFERKPDGSVPWSELAFRLYTLARIPRWAFPHRVY